MKRIVYLILVCFSFLAQIILPYDAKYAVYTAQIALNEALAAAKVVMHMREIAVQGVRDMHMNHSQVYDAMVGFAVAQKSLTDLASAHMTEYAATQDVREQAIYTMQAPLTYVREISSIGTAASTPCIDVRVYASKVRVKEGITRKDAISLIRQCKEAKAIIGRVNSKFFDIARAFEEGYQAGDFDRVLSLVEQIRLDIQNFKKLAPVSYLLIPEIEKTLSMIEWPLLNYAAHHKECLKLRDFEQIAWALESHFRSMHDYTREARMRLPEGSLKKIIDDYYSSWYKKPYKWARYYAVYAKRDLQDLSALRVAYEKMTLDKPAEHSMQQLPGSAADPQQKLEILQLQKTVFDLDDAIKNKTGAISEAQRTREEALACMVKGDYAMRTMHYVLHRSTYEMLETAGIDPDAYQDFTGNLIQQDTHSKLVQALNTLSKKAPLTHQGQCLKDGALNFAQTGTMLNRRGHVKEAMAYSDMCSFIVEKALDFFDIINPISRSADAVSWALHKAAADDLAQSFETLRANVDQFCSGFAKGSLQGATDFEGIYAGLCNTVETVGHFIKYVGEQEALVDALEFGRYDDARAILHANDERIARIVAATEYITQQAADFVRRAPDMTPEEWQQAGLKTGNFVGREAVQLGIWKAGFTGICKVSNAVVQSVSNCETTIKEFALSAQLSGSPVAHSLFDATMRAKRIENVCVQIGSQHISGIRAIRPELSKEIFTSVAQGARAGAQVAAESGSKISIWYTSLLRMSENLESFLMSTKPGFIDISGREILSITESANFKRFVEKNEISASSFEALGLKPISKKNLKHILAEHTLAGAGEVRSNKSYFADDEDIIEIALKVCKEGAFVSEQEIVLDLGRVVGRTVSGDSTSVVKVFLNGTRDGIRSMYPI